MPRIHFAAGGIAKENNARPLGTPRCTLPVHLARLLRIHLEDHEGRSRILNVHFEGFRRR